MVSYGGLDATFGALADPTRRAILAQLARGETSVSELRTPAPMSLPAVLKHLACLEQAGLLEARKLGRVRRCQLRAAPLAEASRWIGLYQGFWEERLDALDRYLHEAAKKEDDTCPKPKPPRSRSAPAAPSRRRATGSSGPGSSRRR